MRGVLIFGCLLSGFVVASRDEIRTEKAIKPGMRPRQGSDGEDFPSGRRRRDSHCEGFEDAGESFEGPRPALILRPVRDFACDDCRSQVPLGGVWLVGLHTSPPENRLPLEAINRPTL
jgi:hypothetical protein